MSHSFVSQEMKPIEVLARHDECGGFFTYVVPSQNEVQDGVWKYLHECNFCQQREWFTEPFPTRRFVPLHSNFDARYFKPEIYKA